MLGMFIIFRGGVRCHGNGGCSGPSNILGVNSRLSDMYLSLSVRGCACLGHGVGQFWLQLG